MILCGRIDEFRFHHHIQFWKIKVANLVFGFSPLLHVFTSAPEVNGGLMGHSLTMILGPQSEPCLTSGMYWICVYEKVMFPFNDEPTERIKGPVTRVLC